MAKVRGDITAANYAANLERYKALNDKQKMWLSERPLHQTDKACYEAMGISKETVKWWRDNPDFTELERWFLDDPSRVAIARRDILLLLAVRECESVLNDPEAAGAVKVSAIRWAGQFHAETSSMVHSQRGKFVRWSEKMDDSSEK